MPPKLRPVADGETAAKAEPRTVLDAAESGTHLELLIAMRRRIAKAVDDPDASQRDLAALTRRLIEVARDIEAIELRMEQEGRDGEEVSDGEFDASAI